MSIFGGSSIYPNRYLCSVLEEMRDQLKLLDINNLDRYRSITALMIEEVQTLGNRMEAGLEDLKDIDDLLEKRVKLKRDIKKLQKEKNQLSEEED